MKTKIQKATLTLVGLLVIAWINAAHTDNYILYENFDNLSYGVPERWNIAEGSTVNPFYNWVYYGYDGEHPNCVRFNSAENDEGNTGILKSPTIQLPSREMMLGLDFKSPRTAPLSIYISTDGGRTYMNNPLVVGLNKQTEWTHVDIPLSEYTNEDSVQIVFHTVSTETYGDAYVYLDNIIVSPAPLCKKPINLYTTALTQTSATVNWALYPQGANPGVYHLVVRERNGEEIVNNPNLVTVGTSVNVEGLQPGTTYDVMLLSDCSSAKKGTSDWGNTFTFTTVCEEVSLPLWNDFRGEGAQLPECWSAGGRNAQNVELTTYRAAGGEGDKSIKLVSSPTLDASIATPLIDHAANDMEISFKVYGKRGATFMVALTADPSDLSAGFPIYNGRVSNSDKWMEYTVRSNTYSSMADSMAVMLYATADGDKTLYFDDVRVTAIPNCIRPEGLVAKTIDHTNASLEWGSVTEAVGYEINIVGEETSDIFRSDTTFYSFANLAAGEDYVARVRCVCAVGDTSAWSVPVEWRMYCEPLSEYPLVESFEGEVFPPICWTSKETKPGYGEVGEEHEFGAWGPCRERAYIGEGCAISKITKINATNILVSPYLRIPRDSAYEFSFYMYRSEYTSHFEGLKIYLSESMSTKDAQLLDKIANNKDHTPAVPHEGWYKYTYQIPSAGDMFIILESINEDGYGEHHDQDDLHLEQLQTRTSSNNKGPWRCAGGISSPIYVDHIEVRERPSCIEPENLVLNYTTDSSALFSWTSEGDSIWEVRYKTNVMPDYITDTVRDKYFIIGNLNADTEYDFSIEVVTLCGDGERSVKTVFASTMMTQCRPVMFPFYEDFDEKFMEDEAHCWNFPIRAHDFPKLYDYGTGYSMMMHGENVLVTPAIDIEGWKGKQISFDVEGVGGDIRIGIIADRGDTNTITLLDYVPVSGIKTRYVKDITEDYDGKYIAFRSSKDHHDHVKIDNVVVKNTVYCTDVRGIYLDDITTNAVDVHIDDTANVSWEIQCGTQVLDDGSPIDTTSQRIITIGGLSPDTYYYVRVRSVCVEGDGVARRGNWGEMERFKTDCRAYVVSDTLPFFEGFEYGYIAGDELEGCWLQRSLEGDDYWRVNSDHGNNTAAYKGVKNAVLLGVNECYMVRALELRANTNYRFSCYARQDKMDGASLNVFVNADRTSMSGGIMVVNDEGVCAGAYREYSGYFTVGRDGVYYLKIGAELEKGTYAVAIDNIQVEEVYCAPPAVLQVMVEGLTHNAVNMYWNNPASEFVLKISTASIDPNNSVGNVFNDTLRSASFSTNTLEANRVYYYYIQSVCGDGELSAWSDEGMFMTNCPATNMPFAENFDNGDATFGCWRNNISQAKWVTGIKYSGSHSLKCSDIILLTPILNVDSLSKLQFSANVYSEDDSAKFAVGVMSNVADITSFEVISEYTLREKNRWVEVVSYFDLLDHPDYADFAGAKNIAIVVSKNYTFHIDDVRIDMRASCPKPLSVEVDNVGLHSATVSWNAAGVGAWSVEVCKVKVDGKELLMDTVLEDNALSLAGLDPNTAYEVGVRALCGEALEDTSLCKSTEFRTGCEDEFSLPFVENFNHLGTDEIVSCWVNEKKNSYYRTIYWGAYVGARTPTPAYEFNSGHANPKGHWSILETPILDLTNHEAAMLEFEAMNGEGGDLQVLISMDGGANFSDTIIEHVEKVAVLTTFAVDLTPYCGNKVVIGFKGVSNGGHDDNCTHPEDVEHDTYVRIDNIEVFAPTACVKPVSIDIKSVNVDSIQIYINDTSGNNHWQVAVVPEGVRANEDMVYFDTYSRGTVIRSVVPALRQSIFVRSVCTDSGVDTYSGWTISAGVTTPCDRLSLPYRQGFEGVTLVEEVLCTHAIGEGGEGALPDVTFARSDNQDYIHSDAQALLLKSSMNRYVYFALPEVGASIDTVGMSFRYRNESMAATNGKLEVGLIPLSLDTSEFVYIKSFPISENFTLGRVDFAHANIAGTSYRIAFRYKALVDSMLLAIDNIEVDYRNECIMPLGVSVDDVTHNSARLIIADEFNTEWELAYGLSSEYFNNLTRVNVLSVNTYELTGLSSSAEYQVYARALCGGEPTPWTEVCHVNTMCGLIDVDEHSPYAEYFQSYNVGEVPACWSVISNQYNENGLFPTVGEYAGDMSVNFEGRGYGAIALPLFSTPLNRMEMSFEAVYRGDDAEAIINVGYTNDLTDVGAIKDVYNVEVTAVEERIEIDLTILPASAKYIVLSSNEDELIEIDNIELSLSSDIYPPKGLRVENMTTTSADILFSVAPNSEEVEYVVRGLDTGGVVATGWTEEDSVYVSGLVANEVYEVAVRSVCSALALKPSRRKHGYSLTSLGMQLFSESREAGDTTQWSTAVFSTLQVPTSVPYVHGFDNGDDNDMWSFVHSSGDNVWIISDSDPVGAVDDDGLYISSNDSANIYNVHSRSESWAYRTLELERGVYEMSYMYKNMGEYTDYVRVYLLPEGDYVGDMANAIFVDNGVGLFGEVSWVELNAEVAVPVAGNYNVVFAWVNDNSEGAQRPAAIDDIRIERRECAPIVSPYVAYLGVDSVVVDVDDYNASALAYQVYMSVNVDDSPMDAKDGECSVFADEMICVGGLERNMRYYMYVRAICAAGDTGVWSQGIMFSTACAVSLVDEENPFVEGFEYMRDGEEISECWVQSGVEGEDRWVANKSLVDFNRMARSGAFNAYLAKGGSAMLVRDVLLEAGVQYTLSMWARQDLRDGEQASVAIGIVRTEDVKGLLEGHGWHMAHRSVVNGEYQEVKGAFVPEEDGRYTIVVAGEIGEYANYLSIDDVSLIVDPCPMPRDLAVEDISSNAARMRWMGGSDSTHIVVKRHVHGASCGGDHGEEHDHGVEDVHDHDIVMLDTVVANTLGMESVVNVGDLLPVSEYHIHATNVCGGSDGITYELSFNTTCGIMPLPFYDIFDGYAVGVVPPCWDNTGGTVSNASQRWRTYHLPHHGHDSELYHNVMRFDSYGNLAGEVNVLKSPVIHIDTEDRILSFAYKNSKGGAFSVYISTDEGLSYADTVVDEATEVHAWREVSHSLGDFAGEDITLVFHSVSNNGRGDAYHYVDNVRISCDGGVRNVYDTICSNVDYSNHGFSLSAEDTHVAGTREFSRLALADEAGECDTTMVLHLTINPSYDIRINDQFCAGSTYNNPPFVNLREPGLYTEVYISSTGCDSLITLNLIEYNLDSVFEEVVCEGDTVQFYGNRYTETGVYTVRKYTPEGCRSTKTLNLTVIPDSLVFDIHVCEGESYVFEDSVYWESGRYAHSFINSLGCDSVRVLNLIVHQSIGVVDVTICRGNSYFFGGAYREETGTYKKRYVNAYGCDSTAILNLTVSPADTTVWSDYACEGEEYYGHGFSGIDVLGDTVVYQTGITVEGCDTVVELHLKYILTDEVYISEHIGDGEVYHFGGDDLSEGGSYQHTFTSRYGCDSIVYLELKVGTGLDNYMAHNELALAPNPAGGGALINISGDALLRNEVAHIEILSAGGALILSESNPQINAGSLSVYAPTQSGVYTVRVVYEDGGWSIAKLIVE